MARLPARPHQIPRDERLAVARCERVRGTPERGDEQGHQDDADRQFPRSISASNPRPRWLGAGARIHVRSRSSSGARLEGGDGGADVERRAKQITGIRAQLVRATRARDGGVEEPRAVAGRNRDLPPADPRGNRRSANVSARPLAAAVKTASKRSVFRPPAPRRATTRCATGRRTTRVPSSRSSRLRATVVAKPEALTSSPNWNVGISATSRT